MVSLRITSTRAAIPADMKTTTTTLIADILASLRISAELPARLAAQRAARLAAAARLQSAREVEEQFARAHQELEDLEAKLAK